ncbi:MAG: von Willebrand factor [Burkholderiaceae bacterium]|nr:von Willebrand factor [Burkholderiaceae bacterium]
MLTDFFLHLRNHRLPVSTTEYLALLEALKAGLANYSLDDFYTLSRLCMVKNEAHYDKFDVAFGEYFRKLQETDGQSAKAALDELLSAASGQVPPEDVPLERDVPVPEMPRAMSRNAAKKDDAEEEGTPLSGGAGNNPFGEGESPPEGERTEPVRQGTRSAVKAWDSREFKALDEEVELNVRSTKIALRRLRKFAREGTPDELDLDSTIASTARNAGWLDLQMRPERRNKVKVLILFDIGGSMAPHVKLCEELFSAARSEFKQLERFYFHNCVYDSVWRYDNARVVSHYPLPYLMNRFGKEYKLILVGDASMGPVEITDTGMLGLNKNDSNESGATWMTRLLNHYRHAVWLNPEPERYWPLTQSIGMLNELMDQRMYPLTLAGLERAMTVLGK